jgi:hypothetical protein
MPDITKSEKEPGEKVICLFPGCEREAVDPPKKADRRDTRQGPPPRYCDNEEHNASSTFQELKRLEQEKGASAPS